MSTQSALQLRLRGVLLHTAFHFQVGIVEGILLSLEMHPGAAAVQENGLFVLLVLASNQGTNLEHNINLGRSLISAPTASAREDLDITRENIALAGGARTSNKGWSFNEYAPSGDPL
eukprot:COSAG02_NODE_12141_length_1590_cov_2.590879_3_plen_117_part_00